MKPSELTALLTATIPAGHPVLIQGKPGIGKTDIVHEACKAAEAEMIISHPAVEDPTDSKGLPFMNKDGKSADFMPFGMLKRLMETTKRTVWFLDDFGQAAESVQKAYMQWLLGRELAGKRLSDEVTIIVATNGRSHRAGVSGLLEPVKSRFATIVELKEDLMEWCNWAITSKVIPGHMIAFLRFKPALLCDFQPTADLTNSPSPRTWHNAAKMEALNLPASLFHQTLAGSVGKGAATEYIAFVKMAASLQSIDAIIADPQKAILPKNASERYAICTALAMRANDKTFNRIGQYSERLAKADMGEFAALTIRDSIRRTPSLANTQDYVNLMCGPIGQLISGQTIS